MDNRILKFNLSPSAIKIYEESQLQFYYAYIIKAKPDTKVFSCYGHAGTLVHNLLEEYANNIIDKKTNTDMLFFSKFETGWNKYKLNTDTGFNGKPLKKEDYIRSLQYGIDILNNKYNPMKAEETIVFPLVDNDKALINIKGIIDLQAYNKKDEWCIVDWKTSSSMDNFKVQATHYAYSVYRKYGIIPKVFFIYVKLGKNKKYYISEQDIKDYGEYLDKLKNDIIEKGFDISKYELGNIATAFNVHEKKCKREALKRDNKDSIIYNINKSRIEFLNLSDILRTSIDKKFSYFVDGYIFSDLYKKGIWDGKTHLFKNNTLPLGLFNQLERFLEQFNNYFDKDYKLICLEDKRNKDVMKNHYNTQYKNSDIILRDYQEDSIRIAIDKKHGIVYCGTGAGKTIISAEIIKRINKRTLVLINRIELVDQTAEMFEDYLGVKIGIMSEGVLDISNQITVASIQTIASILKRKDNSSKQLSTYLYNLNCIVYDECQTVKDDGMYKLMSKEIINAEYIYGMSGSPFRADCHTMKMNALVGDVIYTKTTKELEQEGYLVPTLVNFITIDDTTFAKSYSDAYQDAIVNNAKRNRIIYDIVAQNRDKKKILILTKLINHGELLAKLIPKSILINSKTNKKIRKEDFKKFKTETGYVLIGSTQIFSTGINIPDLDIIINASAHKSDVQSVQTIGRVKRKSEGKKFGYFIDFYDKGHDFFKKAADKRMAILNQYGNDVTTVPDYKDIIFT